MLVQPDQEQLATLLQAQWDAVGFRTRAERVDGGLWWDRLMAGDYDVTASWWYNENEDPDLAVRWAHCGTCGSNSFYTNYNNERINELTEAALRESDPAAREAMYRESSRSRSMSCRRSRSGTRPTSTPTRTGSRACASRLLFNGHLRTPTSSSDLSQVSGSAVPADPAPWVLSPRMPFLRLISLRLLQAVPVLLGVSIITFVLMAATGDPVRLLVGPSRLGRDGGRHS
jgi:hypothetical protein